MAKILIVEDNPMLRKAYADLLAKEGFTVEVAEDGEDGLRKAAINEPDLILLDLLMPHVDGVTFLQKYDVLNTHKNVKVVVFSNMSIPDKIADVMKLGASNYITKALFSPKEIVDLIRTTLSLSSDA